MSSRRVGPPDTVRGPLHGNPYLRHSRPVPEAATVGAPTDRPPVAVSLHPPHPYAAGQDGHCGLCPLPADHQIHALAGREQQHPLPAVGERP